MPITIDFETRPIEPRPHYPPVPVGFSLKRPGRKSKYYAWGHPAENNCTLEQAKEVLGDVWGNSDLLFHNGKFDIDVAQTHMGLGSVPLDPLRCHDTMFLLFLMNPHSLSLGLKASAEKLLGMPPTEQSAVRDWLVAHQHTLKAEGLLPANARITPGNFGAWICLAPGGLVGRYADGDVLRTEKLYTALKAQVERAGMWPAYQREQKLVPILLTNEREGMRCDIAGLEKALLTGEQATVEAERWLRKTLHAPDLNFDSDAQLSEALDREGVVTEWSSTLTGKRSMNKKTLKPEHYQNQKVFQVLGYRSKLATCLQTYIRPWLDTARETDGILFAGWNQTRNDHNTGTRTGRLSSSPNFMAVAKSFEDKGDGWTHPAFLGKLPPLPLMRQFLLPDSPKHWWGRRDYNQQELRILAHFEDDKLLRAYLQDPNMDVHTFVQKAIQELLGLELPRTPVKTLNFGLLYGQGLGSMAEKLGKSVEEVRVIRNAQLGALPGLKALNTAVMERGRLGQCITTWGGRQYYAEPPKMIEGRMRTFEYKLLNYLIQGSAADCTKEAIIRYHEVGTGDARFIVTVHDEINISAPKGALKKEMLRLREAMMSVEFDVPLCSDGEFGATWGSLQKLKESAPDLSKWKGL